MTNLSLSHRLQSMHRVVIVAAEKGDLDLARVVTERSVEMLLREEWERRERAIQTPRKAGRAA